jgi:hypothetical protein
LDAPLILSCKFWQNNPVEKLVYIIRYRKVVFCTV